MSIKRKQQLTNKQLLILESEMALRRKDMGRAYTLWLIGGSLALLHHFYLENVYGTLTKERRFLSNGIR